MKNIFTALLLTLSISNVSTSSHAQLLQSPFGIKQIESENFYEHYPDLINAVQGFENELYFANIKPQLLTGQWQRTFAAIGSDVFKYVEIPNEAPRPSPSFIEQRTDGTYVIREDNTTTPITITGRKLHIDYPRQINGIQEICGIFQKNLSVLLCKMMDQEDHFEIFIRPGSDRN